MKLSNIITEELCIHIDDERPPVEKDAIWLKNYYQSLNYINNLKIEDKIHRINFDNDISDDIPGHDGYEILKLLLNRVLDNEVIMPKEIMVHTQNQINRQKMIDYIKQFSRFNNIEYKIVTERNIVHNNQLNRNFIIDGVVFIFG